MSVGRSVGRGTEFEFLALRPFSLSKLALIDADEEDDEEEEKDDDDDEDDEGCSFTTHTLLNILAT